MDGVVGWAGRGIDIMMIVAQSPPSTSSNESMHTNTYIGGARVAEQHQDCPRVRGRSGVWDRKD